MLGLVLAGCGSGGDATTQGGATGQSAATGSGASRQEAPRGDEAAAGKKSESEGREQAGKRKGSEEREQGSGEAKDPSEGSAATRQERAKRKLEKECPPNLSEDACAALVEGYITSGQEKSKGRVVSKPEDCTRVRSREECEATLRAQKAAEGTEGVEVEECLENPTPRCEEVLRVVIEQQQAAEAAGG